MKKTLREVIEKYSLSVRLTPNQNIILCDIRNAWKRPITTALAQAGLLVIFFSPLKHIINMIFDHVVKQTQYFVNFSSICL